MSRSLVSLLTLLPALSASAAEGGSHGIPLDAKPLFGGDNFLSFLTNSIFVALIVTGLILWFVRRAMTNPMLVPGRKQNVVEFVIEFLYKQTENILGPKVAKQAFPLLATIFVYVTVANWFGLFPGVGTIGFNPHQEGWSTDHVETPLLRPATADMNLTLGMALCAFVVWFVITIREIGFKGLVMHTFGPKGGITGCLGKFLVVIFLIVGFIEVISILVRPVTLSLRLYGNVFAGENLLHSMGSLGKLFTENQAARFIMSVLFQLPFYFLEILVGILQGMVFAMLNAVYIKLTTTHDESHGDGHAHAHAH
ncbi:MAG TPA: F0F1 ATP synthase subunit A [Verrucomicrobiales bacterium]|nr:F0F1 ATP synthase subunit A [Verrucomicrobiales bacterium]